jgi:hypothetical protein
MLAGVPVSFLGMYLIDEFNRQNPKPELFALGGLAFAFAGGIVSVAGLIAGIAFGIAFAKMGAPSLLFVIPDSGSYRYHVRHRTIRDADSRLLEESLPLIWVFLKNLVFVTQSFTGR